MDIMKATSYSVDSEDFVLLQGDGESVAEELTVTITLHEYRELVKAAARKEAISDMAEKWELRQEVDRLKQRILEITTAEEVPDGE